MLFKNFHLTSPDLSRLEASLPHITESCGFSPPEETIIFVSYAGS